MVLVNVQKKFYMDIISNNILSLLEDCSLPKLHIDGADFHANWKG